MYIIKITEILERTIIINDASSVQEALELVQEDYKKGDIVLDSSDFIDVSFTAS